MHVFPPFRKTRTQEFGVLAIRALARFGQNASNAVPNLRDSQGPPDTDTSEGACGQERGPQENNLTPLMVYAIPDPHIERWFLLDSAAFKTVLDAPPARATSPPGIRSDRYETAGESWKSRDATGGDTA
jgi:hypothetical protein